MALPLFFGSPDRLALGTSNSTNHDTVLSQFLVAFDKFKKSVLNAVAVRVTGDQHTGRLLGAQIAGHWKAEVAKRIDVFATALFHGMKVEDLNALDLSYTPPLGSPWDAVQVAAQDWSRAQRRAIRQGERRSDEANTGAVHG